MCIKKKTHLSIEAFGFLWWVILGVSSHHTTTDFLDGDVLDVESNIVTRQGLSKGLVMHLDRLYLGGDTSWTKGHNRTRL